MFVVHLMETVDHWPAAAPILTSTTSARSTSKKLCWEESRIGAIPILALHDIVAEFDKGDVDAIAEVRERQTEGFRLSLHPIQLLNEITMSACCLDLPLVLPYILMFARTLSLTSTPSPTWGPRAILGVLGVALFAAVAELP